VIYCKARDGRRWRTSAGSGSEEEEAELWEAEVSRGQRVAQPRLTISEGLSPIRRISGGGGNIGRLTNHVSNIFFNLLCWTFLCGDVECIFEEYYLSSVRY
jgi:hypothetical protein